MTWNFFSGAGRMVRVAAAILSAAALVGLPPLAAADPAPAAKKAAAEAAKGTTFVYRVTGLFSRDRVEDLQEVMKEIPEVAIEKVDYDKAEATFAFDAAKVFPGAKPHQVLERLDNRIRTASRSTFGLRTLAELPREKQERLEISVRGLDCKGCCLAAYESVYKIDGVEQATASFKDGLVVAWIDPAKTDRAKLEAALKQKGVELPPPPAAAEKPSAPAK